MGEFVRIALIVVGSMLGVIIVSDCVFYCWFKRKREFIDDICMDLAKALSKVTGSDSQKEQS